MLFSFKSFAHFEAYNHFGNTSPNYSYSFDRPWQTYGRHFFDMEDNHRELRREIYLNCMNLFNGYVTECRNKNRFWRNVSLTVGGASAIVAGIVAVPASVPTTGGALAPAGLGLIAVGSGMLSTVYSDLAEKCDRNRDQAENICYNYAYRD